MVMKKDQTKKKRKGKHYLNNQELYEEIVILKEKKDSSPSDRLFMLFYEMAYNIITRTRFNRYTSDWKEDMIHDALIKCIKVARNFDIKRSNPFSYFTTVICNCFKDYAKKENKQVDIKKKYRDIYGMDGEE